MTADRQVLTNTYLSTEVDFNDGSDVGQVQIPTWGMPAHVARTEMLEDRSDKADDGEYQRTAGSRVQAISFNTHPRGLVTPALDTITATQQPLGKILAHFLGTQHLGTGTTATGAGTALAPGVTTHTGFQANSFAGFQDADGRYWWRPVTTAAANVLTLRYALPEAPTNTLNVAATASYVKGSDNTGSLSMLVYGERSGDRNVRYKGIGIDKMTLDRLVPGPGGQLPAFGFAGWAGDVDDTIANTALTAPTVGHVSAFNNSQLELVPFGTTAYDAAYAHKCRGFEFTMDRGLSNDRDPNATQGIAGYTPGPGPFLRLKFTVNATETWRDAIVAGSRYHLIWTVGNQPGKTVMAYFPQLIIVGDPDPGNDGGTNTVTFEMGQESGYATPIIMAQG